MMSKKDYQAIARALYWTAQEGGTAQEYHERIVHRIADYLQSDNPRFDRARFDEACETGKTKGMRQVS